MKYTLLWEPRLEASKPTKPVYSDDLYQLYTYAEAAVRLRTSAKTIQRAIRLGKIKTVRVGERGRRISEKEIRRLGDNGGFTLDLF